MDEPEPGAGLLRAPALVDKRKTGAKSKRRDPRICVSVETQEQLNKIAKNKLAIFGFLPTPAQVIEMLAKAHLEK